MTHLNSKGFTLIEVLIALTITSFIITALYATFFLSQKAIDSLNFSLIKLQETRSAIDSLRREIESAFYLKEKEYSLFKLEDRDFYGRSLSRLTFTTFSPSVVGLAKISYRVEENEGRLILKKIITSAFNSKSKAKEFELIEDIHSFLIEVKVKDNWIRTWDSSLTHSLPEEVRMSITFYASPQNEENETPETFSIFDLAKPMIGKPL